MLVPCLPYPATDGGRIVVFETLKGLAGRGYEIVLLGFGTRHDPEAGEFLRQFCQVETIPHEAGTRPFRAFLNMFSFLPYAVQKYHSPGMVRALAEMVARGGIDLVQIEHLHMAQYLPIVDGRVPVVLRQHNVESLLTSRYGQVSRGAMRLYGSVQAPKMRRFEREACARADACLVMSEYDQEVLRGLSPGANLIVVPAGVNCEYFRPMGTEEPGRLVAVGTMSWPPNVDGVGWFCRAVLPLIRKQVPGVQLFIVGKDPPLAVRQLARLPGVFVTGFVSDVRPYVSSAMVCVVPLRAGSGVRVKVLEALSMGKGVVATSLAVEGLAVADRTHVLLADTPEDFASRVLELLQNRELRKTIGERGRALVKRLYTWDASIDLLERAYESAFVRYGERKNRPG